MADKDLLATQMALNQQTMQMTMLSGEVSKITESMGDMADLLEKVRDLTRDEVASFKGLKDQVEDVAESYRDMFQGRFDPKASPYSIFAVMLEDGLKAAQGQATALDKAMEGLRGQIRGVSEEMQKLQARRDTLTGEKEAFLKPFEEKAQQALGMRKSAGEQFRKAHMGVGEQERLVKMAQEAENANQMKVSRLRFLAVGKPTVDKRLELQAALGTDETNVRMLQKMARQDALPRAEEAYQNSQEATRAARDELDARKERLKHARDEYQVMKGYSALSTKDLDAAKQKSKVFDKDVGALKLQLKTREQERKILEDQRRTLGKDRSGIDAQIETGTKRLQQVEAFAGKAKRRRFRDEDEDDGAPRRPYARNQGVGLLEAASIANLPGVSQAATVARIAQRSAQEAGSDAEGNPLGGLGGLAAKGMGWLKGGVIGAGLVGAGYAAVQGYRIKSMAPGIAESRTRLAGIYGPGHERQITAAQQMSKGLGYGPQENLAALQAGARSVGHAALGQLPTVSRMSRSLGVEREELFGLAGQTMRSGGATPADSMNQLKKVLAEGMAAGLDRALLTTFAQEAIGLQEENNRLLGRNNMDGVARTLSTLMRASGERKESFMGGAAMTGIRALDAAVKGQSRGTGGIGAGFMMRALGFGSRAQTMNGEEAYYETRKEMEKGLFGGSAEENIGRMKKIFETARVEFGGTGENADKRARVALSDNFGVNISQLEAIENLLSQVDAGQISNEDFQKKVQEVSGEGAQRSPYQDLLEVTKEEQRILAKGVNDMLPAIIKVQEMENALTRTAVDGLQKLADAFGLGSGEQVAAINDLKDAMVTGLAGLAAMKGASDILKNGLPDVGGGGGKSPAGGTPKEAPKGKIGKALEKIGGSKAGKLLKGAGKVAGKALVVGELASMALEGGQMAMMGTDERNLYLDQNADELGQKGVLGRAWEGFTNPVKSVATAAKTVKDGLTPSDTKVRVGNEEYTTEEIENATKGKYRKKAQAPVALGMPGVGAMPAPGVQDTPDRLLKLQQMYDKGAMPPQGGKSVPVTQSSATPERTENTTLVAALEKNTKALQENTTVTKIRNVAPPGGTVRAHGY